MLTPEVELLFLDLFPFKHSSFKDLLLFPDNVK